MKHRCLTLIAVFCAMFLTLATVSSCASTGKNTADTSEMRAKKKKKKDVATKNYSLFKKKELNQDILRRGQKAMASPALDSY